MIETERNLTITSTWTKENKICHVHTNRDPGDDFPPTKADKVCKAWFTGYNPFPCYTMETTYAVLADWLKANGWEKQKNMVIVYTCDQINTETGEVVGSWRTTDRFSK